MKFYEGVQSWKFFRINLDRRAASVDVVVEIFVDGDRQRHSGFVL